MNKIILIVIILVIVVGGYLVFKDSPNQEPEQSIVPDTILNVPAPGETDIDETVIVEESPVSEVLEVTIIGTEFAFSPSTISAQAGQQVIILFKNQGNVPHDLAIEELGINTTIISGGQTDSIEFIAPSTGTYSIFCSVGSHRSLGMEGNLIIE